MAACLAALFLAIRGGGGRETRGRTAERDVSPRGTVSQGGEADTPHGTEGALPPDYRGDGAFIGIVVFGTAPVADAVVGIWLDDAPWTPPLPPFVTRTNAEGRFRLEGVRTDISATLFAFKPGFAVASVEKAETRVETELSLEKGATLTVATKGADGDPLGGVSVQVAAAELWPPRQGITDDRGLLRIEGLVPGEYEIVAMDGELNVSKARQIALEGEERASLALKVSPAAPTVFRVLDAAEGAALTGATVALISVEAPLVKRVAVTGKEGRARFALPPGGRYQAVVTAAGFLPEETAEVTAGDSLSLHLQRGATLSGVVQDLGGRPVQGASLTVKAILGAAPVDDRDTGGVMFNRAMTAAAAAGWPRLMTVDGAHVIPGPLQVPLPVSASGEGGDVSAGSRAWSVTDEAGRFLLNGLPPGWLTVTAGHEDYVMAEAPPVMVVSEEAPAKNVLIRMDEGTRVSARVVDSDNFPLADAEVFVFDTDGGPLGDGVSATDGYALFSGLPAAFRIEASLDGYVPTFVRHEGRLGEDVDIRIRLAAADKVLQGRVRNRQGADLGGVAVMARAKNRGQIQVLSGVTRPDGRFEIPGAGSGYYNVAANAGEEGVAVATSVTHADNITLVVQRDGVFSSAAGVLIPPPLDSERDSAGVGPGVDNLGTTDGTRRRGEAKPLESGDRLILPSTVPPMPSLGFDSDIPDNLGVAPGGGQGAVEDAPETASEGGATPFGEAGELSVTAPPPGKGGLPISLGGGAGKVVVTRVSPGSRVQVAGLTEGSRILSVDGKRVKNPADARRAIQGTIGTVVMLEVLENDEVFTLVVQREATR